MSVPGVHLYDPSTGGYSEIAKLLKEHWETPFTEQMDRDVFALNRFKKRQGVGAEVQWKLHVGGNSSAGPYAERDPLQPAGRQLYEEARSPFRFNRVVVEVTGPAEAATRGQGGFFEILGEEMRQALEDLKDQINRQILSPTQVPNGIDSIYRIVDITTTNNTYAGLDRSNTWWQPAILDNGGVARPLTIQLMQQMYAELEKPHRGARVTAIWTSRKHYYDYGNLLQEYRRYVDEEELDGGFKALMFESIPVIAVPRLPEGDMFFLDESEWAYYVLENFAVEEKASPIDARVFVIKHYSQLVCKALAKQGRIKDLE